MLTRYHDHLTSIGLLILRLGIGGYMLTHGSRTIQMIIAGDFDKFSDPIGLGSGLSLILVAFAEFICAILVMIGFATRLAAMPIVFAMAVAAFVAHAGDPWTLAGGPRSKQPALMYLVAFLTLVFTGGGRFAIDAFVWRKSRR